MESNSHLYHANDIAELPGIATAFLKTFPLPGIFLVKGAMGAGKTTFIRQICLQLGIGEASSPTFSLVNEYHTASGITVYHFDLYRIKSLSEALDMGMDEYLQKKAYIFIEWPEVILPLLDSYHTIEITEGGNIRTIRF